MQNWDDCLVMKMELNLATPKALHLEKQWGQRLVQNWVDCLVMTMEGTSAGLAVGAVSLERTPAQLSSAGSL